MAIHELEILRQRPYADGKSFAHAGQYTRIDAIAHYRVDPHDPANTAIVDLDKAVRGSDGLVHFCGDLTMLVPSDLQKADGTVLVEVPNRGNRLALRCFNLAPGEFTSTAEIEPGDGYLLERGWCIAWVGWQWDVPRSPARMGLEPPYVDPDLLGEPTQMQLRLQPDMPSASLRLTDQHVGTLGHHQLIETGDTRDAAARLMVRERIGENGITIPRSRWQFARDQEGTPVEDPGHIHLEGGFESGRIYDVFYTPAKCPVVGSGLLALRDLGAFLRNDERSPLAGRGRHFLTEGLSQCGRFLRTYLHRGLNLDERDRQVYDGVLCHIAGGRRGEFNNRYGQPSVQPTHSYGHLFPFADEPQADSRSELNAGLLDTLRERGGLPKIIYTESSAEYHRGDAALTHLDLRTGTDVEPPACVRRYLFASTQHGPGDVPFARFSVFGTRTTNNFNIVDYRPLYRAALMNLRAWVAEGTEPPPSVFPRVANGTALSRADCQALYEVFPGYTSPNPACLPYMWPLDLGAAQNRGVGEFPARRTGAPYPDLVSAVDEDGNETGGVRMPDVSVPVATHSGFNTRDPRTGGEGHCPEYLGTTLPFARTRAERESRDDPRRSIEERYANRDEYLNKVRAAAKALVAQRYLCPVDVDNCVEFAARRYDACMRDD